MCGSEAERARGCDIARVVEKCCTHVGRDNGGGIDGSSSKVGGRGHGCDCIGGDVTRGGEGGEGGIVVVGVIGGGG